MNYKIMAKKNGETLKVFRLDIELDGSILAVYYKDSKDRVIWHFPKDLDSLKIEYTGGSK